MLSNIQFTSFRNIFYLKDFCPRDDRAVDIQFADFSILTGKGERIPFRYFGHACNLHLDGEVQSSEMNIYMDSPQGSPYDVPKTSFYLQLWCNLETTNGKDLLDALESFSAQIQS